MNDVQIGSAACDPLKPSGWLSSRPTHTTVSSSGVKPTNHASRRSLVVPVLPAASREKPAARAPAAVPSLRTLRIMLVDRKSTRLNSSHGYISYAVFCLKKKKKKKKRHT